MILDSPYPDLIEAIVHLVKNSSTYLPRFVILLALKVLNNTIQDRASFDLFKLRPKVIADMIHIPAFFILSENDEFVNIEEFNQMFISYEFLKKLRVVPGTHGSERDESLVSEALKFLIENFDNKEIIEGMHLQKELALSAINPTYKTEKELFQFIESSGEISPSKRK